jgi:hypothetical protein
MPRVGMKSCLLVSAALLAACTERNDATAPAPPSATHTYDGAADFSSTTNTNTSTWSYRYKNGSTRDGSYALLPAYGADVVDTWTPSDPGAWRVEGYLPALGVNRTGGDVTIGTAVTWRQGTMLVHPGIDQLVVLSWLSPSDATVTISFSVTSLHAVCDGGDGVEWFVEQNSGATTLSSGSIDKGSSTGSRTLSGVQVRAGDRISFIVGPRSNYFCDSTQLIATITSS